MNLDRALTHFSCHMPLPLSDQNVDADVRVNKLSRRNAVKSACGDAAAV